MSVKFNDHVNSTRHCEGMVGVVYKSKGITWSLLSRSLQSIWEDKFHTQNNYKTYLQSNINTNKYTYEKITYES